MGPTQINGLPAHVLLVHVVVVMVPLTAIALVGAAARPAWIRRLGVLLPLFALVTLVSVPLTTHAGEWLEGRTAETPLLERHTELGDQLLPWAVGLFVLATALWWWDRRAAARGGVGEGAGEGAGVGEGVSAGGGVRAGGFGALALPVRVTAAVLCAAVAVGAVVQVYRIGDSGAKAAWQGDVSSSPAPR